MYRLEPISNQIIWAETLKMWRSQAIEQGDEGLFLFDTIDCRLHYLKEQTETECNSHCYFLVKDGEDFGSSLLEFSHAMPGSPKPWLKMLGLTLMPSLVPNREDDVEFIRKAHSVVAFSVIHAIELIFHQHPSKELKIYGRTPEVREFFGGVVSASTIDSALESVGLSARLEGRWLVLAKKEK